MAYNFETQSKGLRTLALASARQGSWGIASVLSDPYLNHLQRFDGSAVIDMNPTRRSDAEMSGKGTPFATNGQITMWDLKVTGVKCEMSDWIAVYVFAFLMGKYTVGNVAGNFQHFCQFDTTTRQAIPTTIYLQDTDGLAYKVPDMCITSATVTIGATGAIGLEFDFVGTGFLLSYVMPSPPAALAENYIMASDAIATFGAIGAVPSLVGRHLNSTIKLDNQCSVHRAPGGGLYGLFVRKGKPKFSVSATIAATATDDVFTRLLNNTATAFSIQAPTLPNAGFFVSLLAANLKTAKMGFDGDMTIWNVEMDETSIYIQNAAQSPITLSVNSSNGAFLGLGG